MRLADKIRYLREVEGGLRGLGRAMTQQELMKAIAAETDQSLSQSYLSQIESGSRPHLTNTSRLLLAKFFKVHPGYLVDDPEGYHAELMSDARGLEDSLDIWLIGGAERFRKDPDLRRSLLEISKHPDSRRCLLLLECILATEGLADRLLEVLRPSAVASETLQKQNAESAEEKRRDRRVVRAGFEIVGGAEKQMPMGMTGRKTKANARLLPDAKKGVRR